MIALAIWMVGFLAVWEISRFVDWKIGKVDDGQKDNYAKFYLILSIMFLAIAVFK